jgi:NADPH:quinone reductase-like Zn-dependent oxidoreductase
MRAIRIHSHGGPEVMRLEDIPRPVAGEGERLVRLAAASVNPIDWKIREGLYRMDLPRVLGRDGAGTDEATAERIVGIGSPGRDGTHAEYAVFTKNASAVIPQGISFEAATGLGIAGLSAWIPLVEDMQVSAGQRVLIHGGAGGVGAFAIQIARLRGAEVWTTCSARNSEFCRALGAYQTIDYSREDFAAVGPIFDAVLDTVGGAVHSRSAEVLKPQGILAYLNAAPTQPVGRKDVQIKPTEVRATKERLEALLALGLRVPVESRFALERAAEGYELSRGGHARGKIILQIS